MFYDFLKRTIDIILSFILIIIFFPISLITALAIVIESPGSIFADTPKRVGKSGKPFHLYKFRSMIPLAHQLLHTDPKFKKLLEEYKKSSYKLHCDPRVTQVGRLIRKYSIDEVPQLLNVLKGEMSLVGPRPYYPDEIEDQQKKYPETQKFIGEVLTARPGITGKWQVSGRSEVNFDERIKIDVEYARSRSILEDLVILAKTPWAMISGKGAV